MWKVAIILFSAKLMVAISIVVTPGLYYPCQRKAPAPDLVAPHADNERVSANAGSEVGKTTQLRRRGVMVNERLVHVVYSIVGNNPGGISSISQKQKYQQFRVRVIIPHLEPVQPSMRAELMRKFVLLNRVIR